MHGKIMHSKEYSFYCHTLKMLPSKLDLSFSFKNGIVGSASTLDDTLIF